MSQNHENSANLERINDLVEFLLQGLLNADPKIRRQSAEGLGRKGSATHLPALREANRKESDLNCKVEIVRAINLLEEKALTAPGGEPVACLL